MDAQVVDKILFLGVSVRMFGEDISMWINRQSKEYQLLAMWVASSNLLTAYIEPKGRERASFLLLFLRENLLFPSSPALRRCDPGSRVLWPQPGGYTIGSLDFKSSESD